MGPVLTVLGSGNTGMNWREGSCGEKVVEEGRALERYGLMEQAGGVCDMGVSAGKVGLRKVSTQ